MVWENPPAAVSAMRTMILACASAVAYGITTDRIHYPAAALHSDDATTDDPLPLIVIADDLSARQRYAEIGVPGVPGGSLTLIVHSSATTGLIETFADDLCRELQALSTGLPITGAQRVRASEPSPGQRAAESV
jgi:hypothetical protein